MQILNQYHLVRQLTEELASPLSEADAQIQSMPDASPTKWHLAHTSWFFETFILKKYMQGYKPFDEHFNYLFNSYYNAVGKQFLRKHRGLISRPSLARVMDYRAYVDKAIDHLLIEAGSHSKIEELLILGINHEQQHQELILTDIKHALFHNPMYPAYHSTENVASDNLEPLKWIEFGEGIYDIGYQGKGFSFDNEKPRHSYCVNGFKFADRLVTNAEYIQFIEDGGYSNPLLWLSDGWSLIQQSEQRLPLYWCKGEGLFYEFTLSGLREVIAQQPITHINYYEACAYAHWAGKRLATEYEWEVVAQSEELEGSFLQLEQLHPQSINSLSKNNHHTAKVKQLFGTGWQWTSSSYGAYPGYKPFAGDAGEYNGKFMSSQYVLRGGSCATPKDHFRKSYRNFFYPHQAWQFTAIRLAENL